MAVNLGLGWLCILFVVFSINTVISSYCVALSHGHIFPFLPAISETGVLYPEKYIFRELGNLSGFLFVANAYIRYLQYKLVSEQCPEEHPTLNRLNMLAFITAICSGTGITFVANFEVQKDWSIHDVGAFIAFASGAIYCWLQTLMSYKLQDHGVINSTAVCRTRFSLSLFITMSLLVFLAFQAKSNWDWERERPHYHFLAKLNWGPEDPGYVYRVISSLGEWSMWAAFLLFVLTFLSEFQQVVITSDISSTEYW